MSLIIECIRHLVKPFSVKHRAIASIQARLSGYHPAQDATDAFTHFAWLRYVSMNTSDIINTRTYQHLSSDLKSRKRYFQLLQNWNQKLGCPINEDAYEEAASSIQNLIAINKALIRATVSKLVQEQEPMFSPEDKKNSLMLLGRKMRLPRQWPSPPTFALRVANVLHSRMTCIYGAIILHLGYLMAMTRLGWDADMLDGDIAMLGFAIVVPLMWHVQRSMSDLLTKAIPAILIDGVSADWNSVLDAPNEADVILLAMLIPHTASDAQVSDFLKNSFENMAGWTPREVMQALLARNNLNYEERTQIWAAGLSTESVPLPSQLCGQSALRQVNVPNTQSEPRL